MVKKGIFLLIVFSFLYFSLGWIAVVVEFIDEDTYFKIAAIVGGLVSISSLLSFFRPAMSVDDFSSIEDDGINRIAKAAKKIEELENRKYETKDELDQLTRTRRDMEILVKKASTALFLEEEKKKLEDKMLAKINHDDGLRESLEDYKKCCGNISTLDSEIDKHPDIELIEAIIYKARLRRQLSMKSVIAEVRRMPGGVLITPILVLLISYAETIVMSLDLPRKRARKYPRKSRSLDTKK